MRAQIHHTQLKFKNHFQPVFPQHTPTIQFKALSREESKGKKNVY